MRRFLLLVLCATGVSSAAVERAAANSTHPPRRFVRRYACPVGFFRLKRFCYYLSGGAAPWKEAYFHCRDRNASLAELDRRGKDGTLRRYLLGDQFTKLERWIGGIFNWRLMVWEWGVRGEKMEFQNFAGAVNPRELAWQCTVLDPAVRYKWTPRSCYDEKHYVCQVPAGRLARRRRLQPAELRRKSGRKAKGPRSRAGKSAWAQGRILGSGPPLQPSVRQVSSGGRGRDHGVGVFQGDGPLSNKPQSIADVGALLSDYHSRINEIAREEILLKP